MRPLAVLIQIVAGSAASITFGPGAGRIVRCVLAGQHPDPLREHTPLVSSPRVLGVWTAAGAGSFVEQAERRSWRTWDRAGN
jgi:hypothetical protein